MLLHRDKDKQDQKLGFLLLCRSSKLCRRTREREERTAKEVRTKPMMRSESSCSRKMAKSTRRCSVCLATAVVKPCASTAPSVSAISVVRCTRRSGSPPVTSS
ncbi:hypothetical protein L6452_35906 [Arctium lappa]|uniref:Uncharacterized protein n=1 Tax=Arctium lappa TaxID=4217 RepID=A0ACB8Y7S3_ARCLA|nr:hypothetical protein L6452_35906 [Arctium lappa]